MFENYEFFKFSKDDIAGRLLTLRGSIALALLQTLLGLSPLRIRRLQTDSRPLGQVQLPDEFVPSSWGKKNPLLSRALGLLQLQIMEYEARFAEQGET